MSGDYNTIWQQKVDRDKQRAIAEVGVPLPCPFCKSGDIDNREAFGGMGDVSGYWFCRNCNAKGPSNYFSTGIVEDLRAWNRKSE